MSADPGRARPVARPSGGRPVAHPSGGRGVAHPSGGRGVARPSGGRGVTVVRTGGHVLRERWDVILVVAAGGVLGSLARWAAGTAFPHRAGEVPWATAGVNVTGCLVIGVLMSVLEALPPSRYLRPFLGTGFLGGFTTFSAAMVDTRALAVAGRPVQAGGYLFGSLALGLVAVWLGSGLTRAALARARGPRRAPSRGRAAPVRPAGSVRSPENLS